MKAEGQHWTLSSPILYFEAGFLTEPIAAVLERLVGGWLQVAADWLDSYSQRSTCLCPPSTGFTDAHLNAWICSLCGCWESELKSPGLHKENDFPTEPSPRHICLSSSLPVFCSTSVSAHLFRSSVAHLFCTRTQPQSFVKLDSLSFCFLLCLPFLPLTVFH